MAETSKLNKKSDITSGLNSLSRIDIVPVAINTGEWTPIYIPSDINPVVAYFVKVGADDINTAPWFIGEGTFSNQDILFTNRISKSTLTSLMNSHIQYTASITVSGDEGGVFSISLYGDENQTFEKLVANINRQIGAAHFEIFEGKVRLIHNNRGINTLSIVDTNLFSSLSGFSSLETATIGQNYTNYDGNSIVIIFPFYPDLVGVIPERPFMWVRSATGNTNSLKVAWFE